MTRITGVFSGRPASKVAAVTAAATEITRLGRYGFISSKIKGIMSGFTAKRTKSASPISFREAADTPYRSAFSTVDFSVLALMYTSSFVQRPLERHPESMAPPIAPQPIIIIFFIRPDLSTKESPQGGAGCPSQYAPPMVRTKAPARSEVLLLPCRDKRHRS